MFPILDTNLWSDHVKKQLEIKVTSNQNKWIIFYEIVVYFLPNYEQTAFAFFSICVLSKVHLSYISKFHFEI